jgi:hypothetical protein
VPFYPNEQLRLLEADFNPLATLRQGLIKKAPWSNIIEFATSEKYCGQALYPRQQTLLRLIYLETENMTKYDREVIDGWRKGFEDRIVCGVQPDVWERIDYLKHRGYRRFPHVQAVLGRRASKGFFGAILAAEQIAYLVAMDNPQDNYNIREGKDVFLNVGATSQTQAQRHQYADIRDVVQSCRWLQPYIAELKDHQMRLRTPADLRRLATLKSQGVPIDHLIATLWCVALSASSVAGRGATSYANFFDEFAFHVQGTGSTKSGDEIYEDWQPSLGQFKKDALTYVPSSPFTKTGKFYELYNQGRVLLSTYEAAAEVSSEARAAFAAARSRADLDEAELDADPTMLIIQGPSWMLYEDFERGGELTGFQADFAPENDLRDEEQQRRRRKNPEKFAVERLGQFAEVLGQYLDSGKVDAMFRPVEWRDLHLCQHCDDDGFIMGGKYDGQPCLHPLAPTPFGRFDFTYRIHVDPSSSGANFALAIGHNEAGPPDAVGDVWPHVIIDRLHVWQAADFPENPETGKCEIDYTVVEREISEILTTFPSTSIFSSDQWNSVGFLQRLRKKYSPNIRVIEDTATEKSNWSRAEKFKSAINLGWVHAYKDTLYDDGKGSLLENECKFLSEKNGKVYKQEFGPCQTKDLYDAVSTVAVDLLSEALERWDSGTLTASAHGSTNVPGLRAGREQERLASAGGGGMLINGSARQANLYNAGRRVGQHAEQTSKAWEKLDEVLPTQTRRSDYAAPRTRSFVPGNGRRRFGG